MMTINLYSPDETTDQLYIANYAVLHLRDPLARNRWRRPGAPAGGE